jgi:hypothetical protein
MPVIKHWPQDYLLERKSRRLEELAERDVASALPPTGRLPQDRKTMLEDIGRVDAELAAMDFALTNVMRCGLRGGRWEDADASEDE